MKLYAGHPSEPVIDYLLHRRSAKKLTGPAPNRDEISKILQAATRVPDHGRLFPWYFIVFEGEARRQLGDILKQAWLAQEPDASPAKLELEAERFLRAPVTIAVISKIREGKKPAWEQILSAGASCMTLTLAANALGFATNWITEWYATSTVFREALGIGPRENIAGFIQIGTASETPEERERPDLDKIVTFWKLAAVLKKGENYGQQGFGYPQDGFSLQE